MKEKPQSTRSLEARLDQITNLLEQLVAVQLYRGGATQADIAKALRISVGKVNRLVRGVKNAKQSHGN
jgi:DNA-binding transcriptional regulator LsrR (DeoR family)